jgi:molecular chaperone DnaK
MATLKFGIDLGTTNSLIAQYVNGKVEVFKNPIGHKETLPSVVAFRKDKILVGDKAREFVERDPKNVFGGFKRKMGTSEHFHIESLNKDISPIELSSQVLMELRNFIHTGENLDAAIITIPASFDTIQSNATRKAGLEAGIEEVYLLQEPIAASLAYANREKFKGEADKQWLVYDLGGGTFDIALVRIVDSEMKVVDHQGDNFLGGLDFDNRIIEKIIIPYLYSKGSFSHLEEQMKSASGKHNKTYFKLLKLAEDVKVILSGKETTDIEFEIEDDKGELLDIYFNISIGEFENIIRDYIEGTLEMIDVILKRNHLLAKELEFVLMVGGSTLIPLVRKMITEKTGIPVNCEVDPTTAVAIGAAFYAGTKIKKTIKKETSSSTEIRSDLKVKIAFQKTTQDAEEYFAARIEGNLAGLFYRIIREDGGYDTGLKKLSEKITENLPLVKDMANDFVLKIYDSNNRAVSVFIPEIKIVQGKYNISGQPLPNDLCLEIDDVENNTTKLEVVFEKNSILPLKRIITKEITETIHKDSEDRIIVNILEGSRQALPESNLSIGAIEISGKELKRDLIAGSDIEIILEISESRDLKITTFLMMTDQEFENVFSPSVRHVSIRKTKDDLIRLLKKAKKELSFYEDREEYKKADQANFIIKELEKLVMEIHKISQDDVTDSKYQIDDKKRKYAAQLDDLTRDKKLSGIISEYFYARKRCESLMEEYGNPMEKEKLKNIIVAERSLMKMENSIYIKEAIDKLEKLSYDIEWNRPDYIIALFYHYQMREDYEDEVKAKYYKKAGEKALTRKNYEEIKVIIQGLYNLLPPEKKEKLNGTGIG